MLFMSFMVIDVNWSRNYTMKSMKDMKNDG